jgi:hypothetical protein
LICLFYQKSNFSVPNETQNCIAVEEGKLVVQTTSKPEKHKHIETIEMWTDAFLNYVQIIIDRHPQIAKDLLTYMVTIRGAQHLTGFTCMTNSLDCE